MANKRYEELLFTALKNGQVAPKSVYDIWLELGNEGNPQAFLDSLKGDPGEAGPKGEQGPEGPAGPQGKDGVSAIIVKGIILLASGWIFTDGLYKITVPNADITENSIVNLKFVPASINNAINNGVLGYTTTINGAFEIYANFQPSTDLTIDYAIIN